MKSPFPAGVRLSIVVALLLTSPAYGIVPDPEAEEGPPSADVASPAMRRHLPERSPATTASFGLIWASTAWAVSRSEGDPASIAFIVTAHACVGALVLLRDQYGRAQPGDQRRVQIRRSAWSVRSALAAMAAYKTAAVLPLLGRILVWAVAAVAVVCGFQALHDLPEQDGGVVAAPH